MTTTDIEKQNLPPFPQNGNGGFFVALENTAQFGCFIFVFLAEKQLCAQKTLASVEALL